MKIWHLFFELRCTPAVTRCREKANKCGVTVNSRERKMTHLWLCRQIASPTLRMDTYPATCWVSTVVCEAYPAEHTHIRYCCLVVGAPSCPRCTEVHSGVCSFEFGLSLCFCGPRDPVVRDDVFSKLQHVPSTFAVSSSASNPASPLAHEAYNVSMRGRPAPIGRASVRSNDGGSARISHTTSHGSHGTALKCG